MSLSIKQKFILVVIVATIGFVFQGVIAFSALNKLNATSAKVAKTQSVARIIGDSQIGAFSLSLRRTKLAYQQIDSFEQALQEFAETQQQALKRIENSSDSEQLKQYVNQLAYLLNQYNEEMIVWINIKRKLGVDWTKPVDGSDPELEWGDFHPIEELPQVFNPASGFMQNTNSTPFTTTDDGNPSLSASIRQQITIVAEQENKSSGASSTAMTIIMLTLLSFIRRLKFK